MRRRALLSGGKKDYSQDYFTMVVTVGGSVTWTGSTTDNILYYSKNNGTTWTTANSATTISVNAGDKILWKGTPTPEWWDGIGKFSGATNVRYSVEGNVMSLLFGDNFKGQTNLNGKDCALEHLFKNNTNVTSAENLSLPATTVAGYCYAYMFYGCTSLTKAPSVLPATTFLANYSQRCYTYMFSGCTSLTKAPKLPATELYVGSYDDMFRDCTSLTTAPELPATKLGQSCYQQMFLNCTSLTTAPKLPATTLVNNCYDSMFYGCTSLSSIKCLATDISASNCTYKWLQATASNGTFTKAASMSESTWGRGVSGIPEGWTVRNA